jgi:hypothetical protein
LCIQEKYVAEEAAWELQGCLDAEQKVAKPSTLNPKACGSR